MAAKQTYRIGKQVYTMMRLHNLPNREIERCSHIWGEKDTYQDVYGNLKKCDLSDVVERMKGRDALEL